MPSRGNRIPPIAVFLTLLFVAFYVVLLGVSRRKSVRGFVLREE